MPVSDLKYNSGAGLGVGSTVSRMDTSPGAVNFTAFEARFSRIWRIRPESPSSRADVGFAVGDELQVLSRRLGPAGRRPPPRAVRGSNGDVQVDLARLQLGEVQDVVDEGQQRLAGP